MINNSLETYKEIIKSTINQIISKKRQIKKNIQVAVVPPIDLFHLSHKNLRRVRKIKSLGLGAEINLETTVKGEIVRALMKIINGAIISLRNSIEEEESQIGKEEEEGDNLEEEEITVIEITTKNIIAITMTPIENFLAILGRNVIWV